MVPIDPSVKQWTRFINTFEATEFTDWIDESVSWKTTCYIGDWSPLLKIRVRGPEAKAFFEHLSTNHWPNWKPGQAKHSIMCRPDNGTIVGEGVVMMMGPDDFIYSSVPGVVWATYQFHHGARKFNATLEDVSDKWYLFQVQGPYSVELMDEVTKNTTRDIKFMSNKEMAIGERKFFCLRQGVSGERGFELWGPAADGQAVYSAIVKAGEKYGIRQLGGRAKPVNHVRHAILLSEPPAEIRTNGIQVEAGFPTPGLDFLPAIHGDDLVLEGYRKYVLESGLGAAAFLYFASDGSYGKDPRLHHRTPYDLGWGWLVNFDHEYIGKEALEHIAHDPPNKLVALEWNTEDVQDVYASMFRENSYEYMELPRHAGGDVTGSSIYTAHGNDSQLLGCAVSRVYSYWFKNMISLGVIKKEFAEPGTEVVIKWGSGVGRPQKLIRAVST